MLHDEAAEPVGPELKNSGHVGPAHGRNYPWSVWTPACARVRRNGQDKKKPNRERLGFVEWWSWGDLNPRPQTFLAQIYMFSGLI